MVVIIYNCIYRIRGQALGNGLCSSVAKASFRFAFPASGPRFPCFVTGAGWVLVYVILTLDMLYLLHYTPFNGTSVKTYCYSKMFHMHVKSEGDPD